MGNYPKPGPEHQKLRRLTGAWSARIKYFPPGGEAPEESNGEYLARMDIGGFFLYRDINFGIVGYQGRGLTGWDPFQKAYVGTWVDSTSPCIYPTRGHFDAEKGTFSEISEGPDENGELVRLRMSTEIIDNNQMLFRIWQRLNKTSDEEALMLEIAHTRRRFVE